MKPFLCVDITDDPTNTLPNGEEFIAKSTSSANLERYDNAMSALEATEKVKIPSVLALARLYLLTALLAMVLMLIFMPSHLLSEGIKSVVNLVLMTALLVAGMYFLTKWGKKEARKNIDPQDVAQIASAVKLMSKDIYKELDVPDDAEEVDILCFSYKTNSKDKKIDIHDQENQKVKFYREKDSVCFATLEHKYAIPLDSLQKISKTENQHHILEFLHGNELWGVYFPCYELSVFEKLTSLKAQ